MQSTFILNFLYPINNHASPLGEGWPSESTNIGEASNTCFELWFLYNGDVEVWTHVLKPNRNWLGKDMVWMIPRNKLIIQPGLN